jgi:hypothetical protein
LYEKQSLASKGSTGNNTHPSVWLGSSQEAVAFQFVVEAVGGTPTVTWKVQGSPDGQDLNDANSNWYDVGYITDASDTISQAARVRTAVGADIAFMSNPVARRFQKYRLVTSANTNVTYRGEVMRMGA